MAKDKTNRIVQTADWLSLLLAVLFMISVIQRKPIVFALVLAAALQLIAWYHAKRTISKIGVTVLALLATGLVISLFDR